MTAKTDTDGKTGKNGVGTVSDIPLPWNENVCNQYFIIKVRDQFCLAKYIDYVYGH